MWQYAADVAVKRSPRVKHHDLHYASRRLPPDKGIMGDFKPNVRIRDTSDTLTVLMLLPQDDGFFTITHLLVE